MTDPSTSSGPYYVRERGRIHGPYELRRLAALRAQGRFSRVCEISTDRVHWRPASTLERRDIPAPLPAPENLDVHFSEIPAPITAAQPAPPRAVHPPAEPAPRIIVETDAPLRARSPDTQKSILLALAVVAPLIFVLFLVIAAQVEQSPPVDAAPRSELPVAPVAPASPLLPPALRTSRTVDSLMGAGSDASLSSSLGFVVCGFQVALPDGTVKETAVSTGTCFLVDRQGHALTNRHVVDRTWELQHSPAVFDRIRAELGLDVTPRVWVFFGGRRHSTEIAYLSNTYDLAILKTACLTGSVFRLARTEALTRGERVYALGFPGAAQSPISEDEIVEAVRRLRSAGDLNASTTVDSLFKPRDFEFVQTDGSVSRMTAEQTGRRWIQHTADINPGNSGGPLVTGDGLVHGINTLKITDASGIFYSVSIAQLRAEIAPRIPGAIWE